MIRKVTEKEMFKHTQPQLNKHPQLQFGFTKECSAAHCVFTTAEAQAKSTDAGQPLYIIIMDAQKMMWCGFNSHWSSYINKVSLSFSGPPTLTCTLTSHPR